MQFSTQVFAAADDSLRAAALYIKPPSKRKKKPCGYKPSDYLAGSRSSTGRHVPIENQHLCTFGGRD